jgi:hypothetical protein
MLLQSSKWGTTDDWSTLRYGWWLEIKDDWRLHATLGPTWGTKCDSCTHATSELKIKD